MTNVIVRQRAFEGSLSIIFLGLLTGITTLNQRIHAADLPKPQVSYSEPKDVEIPTGTVGNPIAFFDDFSWRTFVALNWPATKDRGVSDGSKSFGAEGATVWETWKADYEIFQANGQRPTEWNSYNAISPCSSMPVTNAAANKVFSGGLPFSGAIADYNQADIGVPKGCLIAQNKTYVRYEIHVNRVEFDFIRGPDANDKKWLYLIENLPKQAEPTLIFPVDSIEIKAAWKEFKPEESELAKKFHTRKATLVDPAGNCRADVTMGLIGLHIVRKTKSRPEWIWSSFEHVDNLTTAVLADPTADERKVNQLRRPPVSQSNLPIVNPDPVPVKRLRDIHQSTQDTNALYRKAVGIKGTVWENYQLVLTQWPMTPAVDDATFRQNFLVPNYPKTAGNPFPNDADPMSTSFANVTMETSREFQEGFSCMNCHFANQGGAPSTEFVWFLRTRAVYRPSSPVSLQRALLRSQGNMEFLQKRLHESQERQP